jgi:uncharacterized protein YukE
MSDNGLVVQHQALTDIEAALADASQRIATFIADLRDAVDAQTAGWTEETPSRQAQRTYEQALGTSITELTDCLDQVKGAVASYRESAHDAEVENVAIVG